MLKQIFRLTFITFVWKQYKRVIISTILLFAFFWLVNFVHAEFLTFSKFQQQQSGISFSFFIKWTCLTVGFIIYWIFISWKSNDTRKKENHTNHHSSDETDPFETIRHKEKLRTRAEIMLEKKTKHSRGSK